MHSVGDVLTASDWNISSNDLTFLYGDLIWTSPTYTNSWVDFGGAFQTVGFRRVGTRVVMRGTMKSGTISTSAFTLPSGYRPAASLVLACISNSAVGAVLIAAAGTVTPGNPGSNTSVSLDGITFDTI